MTKCHHWGKMTKNDWKWHLKDQIYVLKLMWYFNINCSTFKMLKNDKTWLWVILRKNDKMTKNDTKWLRMIEKDIIEWKWLLTSEKKWIGLEIIKNDQKWQSVIMRKNDKKWLKMTLKGSNTCSKIDVIPKYQLFNL